MKSKGFTLTGLMIVAAILVILVATIVPALLAKTPEEKMRLFVIQQYKPVESIDEIDPICDGDGVCTAVFTSEHDNKPKMVIASCVKVSPTCRPV